MELFEKRNFVFLMAIFLLFMMVSSVNAMDVSEDSVLDESLAVNPISSNDVSISQEIGADSIDDLDVFSSGADEKLSSEVIDDSDDSVIAPGNTEDKLSMEETVDDSSDSALKASDEDGDILGATELHVGPSQTYRNISAALAACNNATKDYEIIIHSGTYDGTANHATISGTFSSLVIRAADGENVIISGHYINYQGQNAYQRIFEITHDNVSFKGITFVNGSGSGGALEFSSSASHISIDNCTFLECGAKTTALQSGVLGGAIHVGLNMVSNRNHDINITNCNFEHCLAQVGGCIRTETGTYDVNIKDCNFNNNSATKHGAVTCLYGTQVLVENCNCTNNNASSAAAIQMHTGNSTIRNCTFINNTATGKGISDGHGNGYGGAIGLVYTNDAGSVIDGCTFENNSAVQDGGAINIEAGGGNAVITNSNFTNNTAPQGGAIIISGGNSTIENVTFFDNHANQTDGGAIYIDGRDTTVNNVTLANNTAAVDGAGVHINGTNTHIYNSTIENNTAGGSGAGLYIDGRNTVIDGCNLTNNNASVNGGGAYLIGSNATIKNSTFTANNAIPNEENMDEGLGGSVYVAGNNSHITECDFTNNTARNGSAIYVNPVNPGNVNYIDNCTLLDNQAWTYSMPIIYNTTHIETNITGGNNILNAIYNNGPNTSIFINNTNPVLGWENSNNGTILYQDVREAYQIIDVVVYDTHGHVVYNQSAVTGLGGNVTFELGEHTSDWFFVVMTHEEDTYYKYIVNGTGIDLKENITLNDVTMYEGNESPQQVFVVIADDSANTILMKGNITVYVVVEGEKIPIANGTTDEGYFIFNESEVFKTLPVNNYELFAEFKYIDKVWDESQGDFINMNKTVTGTSTLHVLPWDWEVIKTIVSVNGIPYEEGMEILENDNITFNITVINNVGANIEKLKITDFDTENFTYVSTESGSPWVLDGANVWTLDELDAYGNSSLIVTFKIIKEGNSINIANASIFNGKENKSANVTFATVSSVILNITKVANASEVTVGDQVNFTITVTNNGETTAHEVVITDELLEVFKHESGGNFDENTRNVTWTVDELAPGASYAVNVVVTVQSAGTYNNTAAAICKENKTETNDTTSITADPSVILEITKEANETELVVGDTINFTITVTNNGLSNATGVVIYDVLPVGFDYVSGADGYDPDTRNVTFNIGDLNGNGNSTTVSFIAMAAIEGEYQNTAVTYSKENESEVEDSTEEIIILPDVSLGIIKVANVTEVVIGDSIKFTITVTNYGKSRATEVVVYDILPEEFEYVSGADSYDQTTRNLTWTINKIDKGANETVSFIATVKKAGEDIVNVAFASSKENDTIVQNATDKITAKKLHLTITVGNYVTYPGGQVEVEITVVDEKNNPFNGVLHIVVEDPVSTDSVPEHKLGATADYILGADSMDVDVNNGKGSFTYSVPEDAEEGTTYVVKASTDESDDYYAAEGTGYVDVEKYGTNTTVSNASGAPGEEVTLTVEVTTEDGEPFNGEVTVTGPNGFSTTVTIKNGKGEFTWTIPEDAENGTEYEFTATFDGNSKYYGSNGTGVVDVLVEDENETEDEPDEPTDEPVDEPVEPVEDDTVEPSPAILKTGNPLIALLVSVVLLGLGLKRKEEE